MRQRIITSLIGLPIVLAAFWFGLPWLSILIAAAVVVGMLEFGGLAQRFSSTVSLPILIIGGLAFVLDAQFGGTRTALVLAASTLVTLLWQTIMVWRPFGFPGGIAPSPSANTMTTAVLGWVFTTTGILYIGFTLSHALLLRQLPGGREWLLTTIAIIFATDTFAYLIGQVIGRHKMALAISPGKTWEGAVSGLVGGIATGIAAVTVFSLTVPMWQVVLLSSTIAVVTQLGDLAESMLKRAAGAKDAGGLLPGHGGILDRLDSLVVGVVVAYYAIRWIGA